MFLSQWIKHMTQKHPFPVVAFDNVTLDGRAGVAVQHLLTCTYLVQWVREFARFSTEF
jgi:hypothetical protein